MNEIIIELIGWLSFAVFLVSIVVKDRIRLHQLGLIASVTTGFYAYEYGATAIWAKWLIAFFFHAYMIAKIAGDHSQMPLTPVEQEEK